jgi:hypothetical protein
MFREAKFDNAKQYYHNSLEKLREWNKNSHSLSFSSSSTSAGSGSSAASLASVAVASNVTIPPSSQAGDNTPATAQLNRQDSNEREEGSGGGEAGVEEKGVLSTTSSIDTTHHEMLANANLGIIQFAEGCYQESKELLTKALLKHQEFVNKSNNQKNVKKAAGAAIEGNDHEETITDEK